MFPDPAAFVDLETTGMTASDDRVTEVGIVRIEGGHAAEWSSLVNPDCSIPAAIQALTGISNAMVAKAPRFAEIASEVAARIAGCVFVAHNARFDYGFLKHEFGRLGQAFTAKVLCTVKLSRRLLTDATRHNLDSLIERHRLPSRDRHRALGDARILWAFVQTPRSAGFCGRRACRLSFLPGRWRRYRNRRASIDSTGSTRCHSMSARASISANASPRTFRRTTAAPTTCASPRSLFASKSRRPRASSAPCCASHSSSNRCSPPTTSVCVGAPT
ncbi:MAG: 3'-5' exonuclease [Betaproteobacteria bacterium]|nr:MAG: 3'-5' exonuclease [Betaproteobacteria bacterium]